MSDYDTDQSGNVSAAESGTGSSTSGSCSNIDTDQSGSASTEEFSHSEFRRYDTGENQSLNEEEFNRYGEDSGWMSAGGSGSASGTGTSGSDDTGGSSTGN